MEAKPEALPQLVEAALQGWPQWAELLMLVDQFEELSTVVAERHRELFINLLAAAAQTPRMRTVATLRADFYPRCLDWPKLAAILRSGTFLLAVPGAFALITVSLITVSLKRRVSGVFGARSALAKKLRLQQNLWVPSGSGKPPSV